MFWNCILDEDETPISSGPWLHRLWIMSRDCSFASWVASRLLGKFSSLPEFQTRVQRITAKVPNAYNGHASSIYSFPDWELTKEEMLELSSRNFFFFIKQQLAIILSFVYYTLMEWGVLVPGLKGQRVICIQSRCLSDWLPEISATYECCMYCIKMWPV